MPRRPASAAPPARPAHTVAQKRQHVARLERRIADLEAFDPATVTRRFTDPNVTALEAAIDDALSAAFGHGTVEYDRYQRATKLDHGLVVMQLGGSHQHDDTEEARQYVAEGKAGALALLRQATKSLTEEIEDEEAPAHRSASATNASAESARAISALSKRIFVVHGHDDGPREAVARFLERLGLQPVILHEQANRGRTIITKFREEAADIGFAIALMTPDDHGGKAGETTRPRARQNVVFELAFFIGRLGPERVAALVKGEVERPSDFDGVVYISLDQGDWKARLGRELEAAGYTIDWNAVMRP